MEILYRPTWNGQRMFFLYENGAETVVRVEDGEFVYCRGARETFYRFMRFFKK